MTKRTVALWLVLLVGSSVEGLAAQGSIASNSASEELDATVRDLVGDEWGITPSSVVLEWGSGRDDLEASEHVELVGTGARGSFVVRLGSPRNITAMRVRAGTSVLRPIAARRLPRGSVLSVSDIEHSPDTQWGPPQPEDDVVAPGWIAQRTLARGDRLEAPSVRPALSVTSGSPVDIVWRRGGVSVALPGIAAGNGSIGESVLVRSESGKRMRGVVVAEGVVDVTRGAGSLEEGR